MLNISVDWDFSNLVFDDVYAFALSYGGGSGGGIVDALPAAAPAVLNNVTIALPPPLPTVENPNPTVDAVKATNTESEEVYGTQASPVIITLLSSVEAAQTLASYLGRSQPVYWYSQIRVVLNGLSSTDQDTIAELEIGDQIRVSKRFNGMASPVVQDLYVEGIEHEIRPSGHVVVIHTSPATLYTDFILDTSDLDDVAYGLA